MELLIKSWAVWMPSVQHAPEQDSNTPQPQPALPQVPAMTRRRLSRMTKIAFEVALTTAVVDQQISTIFASRHGDLHKTLNLLQQLAANEALSPSQFALSVHNAISGQYSIYSNNRADSNAIAAGADSLHYALLEAAARFATEPDLSELLVVYADEPVPQPYQPFCADPSRAIGLALLLSRNEGRKLQFSMQHDANCDAAADQAQQLLPLLRGDIATLSIAGRQRHWLWQSV